MAGTHKGYLVHGGSRGGDELTPLPAHPHQRTFLILIRGKQGTTWGTPQLPAWRQWRDSPGGCSGCPTTLGNATYMAHVCTPTGSRRSASAPHGSPALPENPGTDRGCWSSSRLLYKPTARREGAAPELWPRLLRRFCALREQERCYQFLSTTSPIKYIP